MLDLKGISIEARKTGDDDNQVIMCPTPYRFVRPYLRLHYITTML